MDYLWHIESDEQCILNREECEFIASHYELCYLWTTHEYIKNSVVDTIITGSSYGVNDIEPKFMNHKVANLSMHNQDLYYDCLQIRKALQENDGIKNVVMLFGYYSMFYDLSLGNNSYKCRDIYIPLLGDGHHYTESNDSYEDLNNLISRYKNKVLDYFGAVPEYYGKAVEREIINGDVYCKAGWYRLDENTRKKMAFDRCQKHNKHFRYLKTYEESVFLLTDLFKFLDENGVKIFIVIPPFTPEYRLAIKKDYQQCLMELLNNVPQEIRFMDMNEIGFDSIKYFIDHDHLNLRGAIEASRVIDAFIDSV